MPRPGSKPSDGIADTSRRCASSRARQAQKSRENAGAEQGKARAGELVQHGLGAEALMGFLHLIAVGDAHRLTQHDGR